MGVNNLPEVVTRQRGSRGSNWRPQSHQSNALATLDYRGTQLAHTKTSRNRQNSRKLYSKDGMGCRVCVCVCVVWEGGHARVINVTLSDFDDDDDDDDDDAIDSCESASISPPITM